jgi:formylmethanofuran dehydrogenase subunit B
MNDICLACGCLCDDIHVVVDGGRIVEAERACSIGRPWFLSARMDGEKPEALIDGQPAERDRAIERAAAILRAAKSPVVWGLTETTIEAVASALAIADKIGAVVDLAGDRKSSSKLEAFQRVGHVSASLGEVKDRADLVVFWGVDPLKTHPRHWERYSVEPRGRFIPAGRSGRFVIVVDHEPSESSCQADLFVPIDRGRQPEAIDILRALIQGVAIDPEAASRSSKIPFSVLEELADRLRSAHYGAMFYEPTYQKTENLLRLVRDLNDGRNATGAASVLSWQSGAATSVDFGLGYPRHLPREASLTNRIELGQLDVVLMVIGSAGFASASGLLEQMRGVPSIVIGPEALDPEQATVSFQTTRPGIESGGTVSRIDGVMLPLRPLISSKLATDRQVLDAICERLKISQ